MSLNLLTQTGRNSAGARLLRSGRRTALRGVTLLELSFAIFVLLFGMLGVLSMYPAALKLAYRGIDASDGAMLAKHAKYNLWLRKDTIIWPPKTEAEGGDLSKDSAYDERDGRVTGLIGTKDKKHGIEYVRADGIRRTFPTHYGANHHKTEWSLRPAAPYYVLMTSGRAKGRIYPVVEMKGEATEIICKGNPFSASELYMDIDGVAEGDYFRIIGSGHSQYRQYGEGGTFYSVYPSRFTVGGSSRNEVIVDLKGLVKGVDPSTGTIIEKTKLVYSYGVVISPPEKGSGGACRIDVFCYRNDSFDESRHISENPRPFAWHVSHVHVY